MKVPYYKGKKRSQGFFRKNSGSSIKYENVVKMMVFPLFLKNGSDDFGQNALECRTNQYGTAREDRKFNFCSVLEIFIHKVSILAKNGESGVQRSLYISRTVYAMENLIWFGIYNKFPFTSVSSDFCLLIVFRVKIWPENGQFSVPFWMVFWHFLGNYLKHFDETWSEVRPSGPEVVPKDCMSILSTIEAIFRVKDGQNRPKST